MCAVIGYGGVSVVAGKLSVGSLVAFYGFVVQLFDPLSGASELYARTQKILASIRQVQFVLALRRSLTSAKPPLPISANHTHELQFTNVTFSYPSNKALLRISFLQIEQGEDVAIGGENGAGKSTLAKLMARVYDPVSGYIQLGGIDIRNFDLRDLRKNVCYIPREPVLFEGTIFSNLRFICPETSEKEIENAISCAGLSSFIASLPHGIHQRIGPGGCQLSGGERQRLTLARALLQRPRILILDEATSCLDSSSETTIIKNIRAADKLVTLIVISHRASTLQIFRRILVLSHGRIVRDQTLAACNFESLRPSVNTSRI